MFPLDDYTPHGYLDAPTHSWALHPSGVLRSLPPVGMGWHVPNVGAYGRNQFRYSTHLLAGLRLGERVLLTGEDFASQGIRLSSNYHSKNIFRIAFRVEQLSVHCQVAFFLVDEDALACAWSMENQGDQPVEAECLLALRYVYNPATTRRWVQGLMSWQDAGTGAAIAGVYAEEDHALALLASERPVTYHAAPTLAELRTIHRPEAEGTGEPDAHRPEAGGTGEPTVPDGCWARWSALGCQVRVQPGERQNLTAILARGLTATHALRHAGESLARAADVYQEREAEDTRFWQGAPRLAGDWPTHWQRGWVYDLETLRMMARAPTGVFTRAWDAMQLQAPRLVLAEAALDTLALSYAHPRLAQELLLSAFESAPLPNVPCIREDGSYNMLTEHGEPCGTAPEWGFPLFCCDLLYRRLSDLDWLRALYPGAAGYIRWWLRERRDTEGWLVYACSYESGQDSSPRFGTGDTGASSARHLRPADLQAALAQAAGILAGWAEALGIAEEMAEWQAIAQEYTERTRQMWQDGWFHDFDLRAGVWSPVRDPMQLAPLLCGCATSEQRAALAPLFRQEDALPRHGDRWHPLVWPPVAFTVIEAAAAAGEYEAAARMTARLLETAYRRSDSRQVGANGGLPGVAREYWSDWGEPDDAGPGGIEGYGWGALGVALLVRHMIGLREVAPGQLVLTPAIPANLVPTGASLGVGPLEVAGGWLRLEIQPEGEARRCKLQVRFRCITSNGDVLGEREIALEDQSGGPVTVTPLQSSEADMHCFQVEMPMYGSVLLRFR